MYFCVFECAGTDIVNMDKTKSKPIKRARDWNECLKAESREVLFKPRSYLKLKVSTLVLKELQNAKNNPTQIFTSGPLIFQIIQHWSLYISFIL